MDIHWAILSVTFYDWEHPDDNLARPFWTDLYLPSGSRWRVNHFGI